MKDVRVFSKEFQLKYPRLYVLVNNAGGTTIEKVLTGEDNLKGNFAGNHFGPFLLT